MSDPSKDPTSDAVSVSRDETTSQRIRREARVVGLRGFHTPSLEAVERRRMQLWFLTAVMLVGISGLAVLLSLQEDSVAHEWLTPAVLRIAVVGLSVGFCAYVIEKELHLRRLSRLLMEERVLTTALSNRLKEVSLLLEAGRAMNSVLDLEAVLDIILKSSLDLLDGVSGSIMLAEGDRLRAVCVRGNSPAVGAVVRIGEGVAGQVARRREPLLINGKADAVRFPGRGERMSPVESALSVPLVSRGDLLGVLNVNAAPGRTFSEYDLRAVSLFAEQAAGAIANARLYEAERAHVAELLELDRMKSEFIGLVSHELRTPLTSILAASDTARRPEVDDRMHSELMDIIERQTRRLSDMVEQLLLAARLEGGAAPPELSDVDLAAVARLAADDFAVSDRSVRVVAPERCLAWGEPDSLRRVIDNLVENAFKYGAPPIEIRVEEAEDRVLLSVVDAGSGIPPEQRERVFERFARLHDDPETPGVGLGLPIVRGLVEACGGRVWIEDVPEGAMVRVSLVAARASASAPEEDGRVRAATVGNQG